MLKRIISRQIWEDFEGGEVESEENEEEFKDLDQNSIETIMKN